MSILVAIVLLFNSMSAFNVSFTVLAFVLVMLALMFIWLPIFVVIGVAAMRSVFLMLVKLTLLFDVLYILSHDSYSLGYVVPWCSCFLLCI